MATPAPGVMSLRAYAKRRGVDPKAVRKAVASGRLRASLGHTEKGQPCITDPEMADREWVAGATKPNAAAPPSELPPPGPTDPPPFEGKPDSLTEAQLRVAVQREEQIRLSNAEKSGQLVDAEAARRDAFECARTVRDGVLNVPDRAVPGMAAEFKRAAQDAVARLVGREPDLEAHARRLLAEVLAGIDAAQSPAHAQLDAELRGALGSIAESLSRGE